MRSVLLPLALLIAAPALGAAAESPVLELVTPARNFHFSLADLKKKLPIETVTLEDPNYKKTKSYDGFSLRELLKLAGEPTGDEVVFEAKDGYAPSLPLTDAFTHPAAIAFQEHGTRLGWEKIQQGKTWLTPAPFYLIWNEGGKLGAEYPWPYQLVKIEIVDFAKKYAKAFPNGESKDSPVMKGFFRFKTNCIRCHSVNLVGGEIGPELNAPKNITEYRDEKTLRAFIRDAGSFRYKSKMPAFAQFSDADVDELLAYLRFMRGQKITKP